MHGACNIFKKSKIKLNPSKIHILHFITFCISLILLKTILFAEKGIDPPPAIFLYFIDAFPTRYYTKITMYIIYEKCEREYLLLYL